MKKGSSSYSDSQENEENKLSSLTAVVIDEEERRESKKRESEIIFPDDLLPGVKSEGISLKKGLRLGGGAATFFTLALLSGLEELQTAAINVLAPDIRDTFGVSDGTITFIASSSAAFVVLGSLPMGWMADRLKRIPIIGWASSIFAGMVFLSGLAVNAFMFFWARFGVGIAKASTIPVHSSVIADTYPIGIRGRLGSLTGIINNGLRVVSPVLVGAIALIADGSDGINGWRWCYYLLGIPVVIVALYSFFLNVVLKKNENF